MIIYHVEMKIILIYLGYHVGDCWFHVPEVWQVLEVDPVLLYPWLQVKDTLVSTGYLPLLTTALLYIVFPLARLIAVQVTAMIML